MKIKFGSIKKEYNLFDKNEFQTFISSLYMYYINKFPLFVNVLMTMVDVEDVEEDQRETLAYTYYNYENERIKIHINLKMVEEKEFSKAEIMFIILHEYLHNFFYHFSRLKEEFEENPQLTNIVADYYINGLLFSLIQDVNFKEKGLEIVDQNLMMQMAEEYNKTFPFSYTDKPLENNMYKWFKEFVKNNPQNNNNNGDGNSNSNQKYDNNFDNHSVGMNKENESANKLNDKRIKEGKEEVSKEDLEQLRENKIEAAVSELESSTQCSLGESNILREKSKIFKKDPFLNMLKLKRIIDNKLQKNIIRSYKRMSRKRQSDEIVFKGKIKEYGQKVVVALDVSGSISEKELNQFYNMINGYLSKHKNDTSLDVIYWSSCKITNANFHENISSFDEILKFKINSSGGTDLDTLHEFINEHYATPITLINITDGYFYQPEIDIMKKVAQYYFVLTEQQEEQIIKMFNNNKVSTTCIKEVD